MITGRDIIVLSNIAWSFSWQRHQQFAVRLARKNRVLFVEPPVSPLLPFHDRELFRAALRKKFGGTTRINRNLVLFFPPPALPGGGVSLAVQRLNQAILSRAIRRDASLLGFSSPLVWNYSPYYSGTSFSLGQKSTIYDCVDEMSKEGGGIKGKVARKLERETLARSDLVLTTSRYLFRTRRPYNRRTFLLPNGADFDRYQAAGPAGENVHPEIERFPAPRIGCSGTFNRRVDEDLVRWIAERRPDWSLLFIGPATSIPQCLNNVPNVHFLGNVPPEQLPGYLTKLSAGIVPYRNSRETRAIHPVKVYDYLAAGLPVVSTSFGDIEYFREVIKIAGNREGFLSHLDAVLGENDPRGRDRRTDFARRNSWDQRIEEIGRILGETGIIEKTSPGEEKISSPPGRS